jgi:hypothetical protein
LQRLGVVAKEADLATLKECGFAVHSLDHIGRSDWVNQPIELTTDFALSGPSE